MASSGDWRANCSQATAGLVPASGGAAQRLVVLQRQRAGGRLVAQGRLVAAYRLPGLAARAWSRACCTWALLRCTAMSLQPFHQAVVGVGAAQLFQVALRLFDILALQLGAGHAVEGVGLVRVHAREFCQLSMARWASPRDCQYWPCSISVLVAASWAWAGRPGRWGRRRGQNQGVLVVALLCGHAFSQRNWSLPEGRNW